MYSKEHCLHFLVLTSLIIQLSLTHNPLYSLLSLEQDLQVFCEANSRQSTLTQFPL